ncbi:MAG: hypothetical protein COA43_13675 [Robiginitomaculum sp.]|nr:MAG: hypothetical protein COA43_13675 [Robiginitomaculum sp.]
MFANENSSKPVENKKSLQTKKSKQTICNAAIWCLDKYGYAETSILRITQKAGVSRGALTHHFPSKENLIVESVERLLQRAMTIGRREQNEEMNISDTIRAIWENLDSLQGRALVEVLIASRTDTALNARISQTLIKWNQTIGDNLLQDYRTRFDSNRPSDEEIVLLFEVCRTFFRGLLVQKSFVENDHDLNKIAEKFIMIVTPYFTSRQPQP